MSARPIRPGLRERTGCHSEPGAKTKLLHTQRPTQRLPNASARRPNPPRCPALVTSRDVATSTATPSWHGRGGAKGRDTTGTPAQPPSLLRGCQLGPRPRSLPIGSRRPAPVPLPPPSRRALRPAWCPSCPLPAPCQSLRLSCRVSSEVSPPPRLFPSAATIAALSTQWVRQKVRCQKVRTRPEQGGRPGLMESTGRDGPLAAALQSQGQRELGGQLNRLIVITLKRRSGRCAGHPATCERAGPRRGSPHRVVHSSLCSNSAGTQGLYKLI